MNAEDIRVMDLSGEWTLYWEENKNIGRVPVCEREAAELGFKKIRAAVPGNFELDFQRAGLIGDPFFGTDTLKMQQFENLHLWYCRKIDFDGDADKNTFLRFEGIDTVAEIYLNGELIGRADNMFIAHEFAVPSLKKGVNDLTVHILPAVIYARQFDVPAGCRSSAYNMDSLYVRKAAHMYGWDIMPRIVSGGLWKEVRLIRKYAPRIDDVFVYAPDKDGIACFCAFYTLKIEEDFLTGYRIRFRGSCGDSRFCAEKEVLHTCGRLTAKIENPKYWWPKNAGGQPLYECVCELIKDGQVVDTHRVRTGLRSVRLLRSETTDRDGNGDFCFEINGRRVFLMGTNWVPLDAFHSRDRDRLMPALKMMDDIGCNVVRVWGGNVYEDDAFYDFCDEHGILVWQDFMMACASYPQDTWFQEKLEREATAVVKRLRNHPALALWAGDNECDVTYRWDGVDWDPAENALTRQVLKRVLRAHDFTRPYLPSSPFVSDEAYRTGKALPEDHLWGPRDYFKGPFYKNSVCHFASETGYQGCPSPQSLRRFLSEDQIWPMADADGNVKSEPLVHASSMRASMESPYAYRIPLTVRQVKTLFGHVPDNIGDFALMSQISQGEAKKYFIERFRVTRGRRNGIIWWNLQDGWPQISDAVVDYYHVRKAAYYYIKRAQQPVLLAFDEPDEDGSMRLFGVNEWTDACDVSYTVRYADTGEIRASGEACLAGEKSTPLISVPVGKEEKRLYLIDWRGTVNGKAFEGRSHYYTNIIDIDFESYRDQMRKAGLLTTEGF